MAHSSKGLHHQHTRKRIHVKHEQYPHPVKWKRVLDKVVVVAGVIGPLMTIPQIWNIWVLQEAAGVSWLSWLTYLLVSVLWLIYGFAHKEKPIIIMYAVWIVMDTLIVIGALIYG